MKRTIEGCRWAESDDDEVSSPAPRRARYAGAAGSSASAAWHAGSARNFAAVSVSVVPATPTEPAGLATPTESDGLVGWARCSKTVSPTASATTFSNRLHPIVFDANSGTLLQSNGRCCRSVNAYVKGNRLGEGSEGVVYAAHERGSAKEAFALKRLNDVANAAHEHNLLAALLPHPRIVAARETVMSPTASAAFLVLQAATCDLRSYLSAHSAVGQRLSVPQVKRVLIDVAAGIAHCHRTSIVHRDLKPSNCLVTHEGRIALTDFGHARLVPRSAVSCGCLDDPDATLLTPGTPVTPIAPNASSSGVRCATANAKSGNALRSGEGVCTLWYRAPELLLGANSYGSPIDVWSLGCVFAELLLLRPLLQGDDSRSQMGKITDLLGAPFEDDWPAIARLPHTSSFLPSTRTPPAQHDKLRRLFGPSFTSEATPLSHSGITLLSSMLMLNPSRRAFPTAVAESSYLREVPLPARWLPTAPVRCPTPRSHEA
uniref:cyclin-dependent kinase n=1 Tax=Haptolina brevifila TaxID=156173 RepID=A0A7S2HCZ9_9EUKA